MSPTQAKPSYAADPTNDPQTSFWPTLAIIISTFSLIFIIFLLLIYSWFCRNYIRQSRRGGPNTNTFLPIRNDRPNRTTSGIDKTVIESLPFFRFSSLRGKRDGLECAVCLSKFSDTEILRLLPNCKHAFHTACIDCWLELHSTCPLCRQRIDPTDPAIFKKCSDDNIDLGLFVERAPPDNKYEELLHRHMHRIVVSGSVFKGRWSDLNSSDFVSLDSEMLLNTFFADADRMGKIKEEMGKKRALESKLEMMSVSSIGNYSVSMAPLLSPGNKCRSEITTVTRFQSSGGDGDEEVRKIWLPIARRTVQLFAGRERRPESERSVDDQEMNN